jgi:hybrid polyketide synthase/nonribosomal peptide synthetase ACE1
MQGSQPVQTVLKYSVLALEQRQIQDELQVEEAYEELKHHVYDLERGELLRVQLLSKSETEHFLVLGYHHINMDGISFEIFFSDLQKAYDGTPFTSGVIQYPDFALREIREYASGKWDTELDYWRSEFCNLPSTFPILPLSRKTNRPATVEYGTHIVRRRVTPQLSAKIKDVCRRFKTTPFHFHLAIFGSMLNRYVEAEDFCIGFAVRVLRFKLIDAVACQLACKP